MPRFRLRLDHDPVSLFQPAGGNEALPVEPGQVVDVPGELVTSRPAPKKDEPTPEPLPDDAFIVANGGEERAWSKAMWELDGKPDKAAKAAPVKES